MGKHTLSLISQGQASGEDETSNSNSSIVLQNPSKRLRNGPFKNCSGRFKGVVPQQNGNWGAQIYANHQRIWLGTFKSEEEAAMAYDSAAINLRSGDSHRNFPWTPDSVQEPNFQSLFSQEAVLGMIRDGSYRSKFENYLRNESRVVEPGPKMVDGLLCRQLFQKELTPSDVGKLNRLVIPKKYAVKYLPRISDKDGCGGGALEDVQLVFYDRLMRMWKFRYCYWSSSQSFVFTRGWSRFVKEKDLRANDTVSFSLCECTKEKKRTFCMIDVGKNQQGLQLVGLGAVDLEPRRNANANAIDNEAECVVGCNIAPSERAEAIKQESRIIPTVPCNAKGVWLFGVQIN